MVTFVYLQGQQLEKLEQKSVLYKKKDTYSNYLINFKGEVKGTRMSPMIRIRLTCFRLCQLLSDIVTGTPFLETFIQSFMWPYVVLKMHMMGLDEI